MEALLSEIFSYLLDLAIDGAKDSFQHASEQRLQALLDNRDAISHALHAKRSLRDDVRSVCMALAQAKDKLGVKADERGLWRLLSDDGFQDDLYGWLMAGGLPEGDAVKTRLFGKIQDALNRGAALPADKVATLQQAFFEQVDRACLSHPVLSRWRHQCGLDYLRGQVSAIRQQVDEAAGIYSPERKTAALEQYCEQALKTWDIIDLTNLPEGDVEIATQNLLVRQLYMPLRIALEQGQGEQDEEAAERALLQVEQQREARRRHAAGHGGADTNDKADKQAGIGELLQESGNLVILGDPGGGKTTLLRWLATALLLRYRKDPALSKLPDVETLPEQPWIPVLIRCRDLGEADLCRDFASFLTQHLLKSTLPPEQAAIMKALILEEISHNRVLLLVDGLDEITQPRVRMQFCQELERTVARYPALRMVVTSRIVGYRDMPYRIGRGFRHGVISELGRAHKDEFAKRWIAVTAQRHSEAERAKRTQELIEALHATDRIERLTGNPMLLTTLALVKRKVGKLPNRRHELYAEAVAVLLNWNPGLYETIDGAEALPQLEYIAFAMCQRGVQRLTDDDIMTLLEQFRQDYPNVRAVRNHSEREFLNLLEARSSILIKAGSIWSKAQQEQAAWEFRHLTFQEYLAAKALIDGKYPGRDKTQTLAQMVAPLAGLVQRGGSFFLENETPESWREALRLLVVACSDDDVEDVLEAILTPAAAEGQAETARPRAILAALCLAEEPNVGDAVADKILRQLMAVVVAEDGHGLDASLMTAAITALFGSQWGAAAKAQLLKQFVNALPDTRDKFGGLLAFVEADRCLANNAASHETIQGLVQALQASEPLQAIAAALVTMQLAFTRELETVDGLADALLPLLKKEPATCFAAAWALGWLSSARKGKPYWQADDYAVRELGNVLTNSAPNEYDTQYWLLRILCTSAQPTAFELILPFIENPHERLRDGAMQALTDLADSRTKSALVPLLNATSADTRLAVALALSNLDDASGQAVLVETWKNEGGSSFDIASAMLKNEHDEVNRKLLTESAGGRLPTIPPTKPLQQYGYKTVQKNSSFPRQKSGIAMKPWHRSTN